MIPHQGYVRPLSYHIKAERPHEQRHALKMLPGDLSPTARISKKCNAHFFSKDLIREVKANNYSMFEIHGFGRAIGNTWKVAKGFAKENKKWRFKVQYSENMHKGRNVLALKIICTDMEDYPETDDTIKFLKSRYQVDHQLREKHQDINDNDLIDSSGSDIEEIAKSPVPEQKQNPIVLNHKIPEEISSVFQHSGLGESVVINRGPIIRPPVKEKKKPINNPEFDSIPYKNYGSAIPSSKPVIPNSIIEPCPQAYAPRPSNNPPPPAINPPKITDIEKIRKFVLEVEQAAAKNKEVPPIYIIEDILAKLKISSEDAVKFLPYVSHIAKVKFVEPSPDQLVIGHPPPFPPVSPPKIPKPGEKEIPQSAPGPPKLIPFVPRNPSPYTCEYPFKNAVPFSLVPGLNVAPVRTPATTVNTNKDLECKICYERNVDTVLNCGHTFCNTCTKNLKECPLCKKSIEMKINLHLG